MSGPALVLAQYVDPHAICFPFCSPEGPGTPFANPLFVVLDLLRIACIVLATTAVILAPRTMMLARNWGQRCRMAAEVTWGLVAANTELEHLGDVGSPRLALNLLAAVLAAAGVYSFYRCEYGTTGSTDSTPGRSGP